MPPENSGIYKAIHGLEYNEVPDGYVIYDKQREQVHFLNLAAAAVLELCDGENNVDAITNVMQDAFDLTMRPLADVEACLALLVAQGLIQLCNQSSSETLSALSSLGENGHDHR